MTSEKITTVVLEKDSFVHCTNVYIFSCRKIHRPKEQLLEAKVWQWHVDAQLTFHFFFLSRTGISRYQFNSLLAGNCHDFYLFFNFSVSLLWKCFRCVQQCFHFFSKRSRTIQQKKKFPEKSAANINCEKYKRHYIGVE